MGRGEEARELKGKQMAFRKEKWALKRTGGNRVGLRQYLFRCDADFSSAVVRVNLPGCATPGKGNYDRVL